MKKAYFAALLLLLFVLPSCADKTEVVVESVTHIYGFWAGLWHGLIAPFDFIGSLIWDDVTMYAEANNGHWYAFGFLIGLGSLSGGGYSIKRQMN